MSIPHTLEIDHRGVSQADWADWCDDAGPAWLDSLASDGETERLLVLADTPAEARALLEIIIPDGAYILP